MTVIWLLLGWLFAVLFGVLVISMVLSKNWPHALILLLLVLLTFPPASSFLQDQFRWSIHPVLRAVIIAGLLGVFVWLMIGTKATSIYQSPQVKAQFLKIYDEKMADWPIPYEDLFLDTEYGQVHVIASGPEGAPAMLLLHASGVASWSWKYNVAALSQSYRTYAIDLIGDAGKSEFASLEHIMKTGEDQARLYAEISDKLGLDKAYVVGASEGGFIASNYALHYPQRVEKMVLLGPMGYSGAVQSIIRITFTQLFPLKSIQESTFAWAFSDSAHLQEDLGEWFPLVMTGLKPVKVAPLPLAPEQRQNLQVPVLFVFGMRDNLVGDPEAARALVQDLPDVRVETLEAGHLMAAELPEQANQLILEFFGQP